VGWRLVLSGRCACQACESCGTTFAKLIPARTRHLCSYCGRALCSACRGAFYPVPAAILGSGNYSLQPVCDDCQAHLEGTLVACADGTVALLSLQLTVRTLGPRRRSPVPQHTAVCR